MLSIYEIIEKEINSKINLQTVKRLEQLLAVESNGFPINAKFTCDERNTNPGENEIYIKLDIPTRCFVQLSDDRLVFELTETTKGISNIIEERLSVNDKQVIGFIVNMHFNFVNFNEVIPIGFVVNSVGKYRNVKFVGGYLNDIIYDKYNFYMLDEECLKYNDVILQLLKDWFELNCNALLNMKDPKYDDVNDLYDKDKLYLLAGPAVADILAYSCWDNKKITGKINRRFTDIGLDLIYERDVEPYLDKKYSKHCSLASDVLRDRNNEFYNSLLDKIKEIMERIYLRSKEDIRDLRNPYD